MDQGGTTCGDEASRSSKAIYKREIINFHDKNAVIARFSDKNKFFIFIAKFHDMQLYIIIHQEMSKKVMKCHEKS